MIISGVTRRGTVGEWRNLERRVTSDSRGVITMAMGDDDGIEAREIDAELLHVAGENLRIVARERLHHPAHSRYNPKAFRSLSPSSFCCHGGVLQPRPVEGDRRLRYDRSILFQRTGLSWRTQPAKG